jgi:hypothetical protein
MEFYTKYYYVFSRFIKFNVYMSSQEFQQKISLHLYEVSTHLYDFSKFYEFLGIFK